MEDIDFNNGYVVFRSKDRFISGTFGGNFNLSIRLENNKNVSPDFKKTLAGARFFLFKKEIEAILKAPPGSKRPYHISTYIVEEKRWKTEAVITLCKDDSMVYSIDVSYVDANTNENKSERFEFMSPQDISRGSEPPSKSERSQIGIEDYLDFLNNMVPIMRVLTKKKWKAGAFGSGSKPDSNVDTSVDFFG